jgi:hypothetical protein
LHPKHFAPVNTALAEPFQSFSPEVSQQFKTTATTKNTTAGNRLDSPEPPSRESEAMQDEQVANVSVAAEASESFTDHRTSRAVAEIQKCSSEGDAAEPKTSVFSTQASAFRSPIAADAAIPPFGTSGLNSRGPASTLPPVRGPKKLRPELREFLDACVVPALVEKFFVERK